MRPGFDSGVVGTRQQQRTRDIILYLAIAIAIVIAITVYTMYTVG